VYIFSDDFNFIGGDLFHLSLVIRHSSFAIRHFPCTSLIFMFSAFIFTNDPETVKSKK